MTATPNGTESAQAKKPLTKRSLALSLHAAGRSVEEIARALECSVEYATACIVPPNRCAADGCNKIVGREDRLCDSCRAIEYLTEDRDGWKKSATALATDFSNVYKTLGYCLVVTLIEGVLLLWKVRSR